MKNYSSIRLEITSQCNLNCIYCHNIDYNNKKNDLSTEEILKLIFNLKVKFPINKVLLTGGEPLINKDIFKIISEITNLGIKVDMVTNGTLLTIDVIKKLEKAGLKRIRISIDEIGEKSELRLNENPNKIWEIAKWISKNTNIEVCIHTVCSPVNVNNLYNIYIKVLEINAKRWRVFDLGYQGGIIQDKTKFNFNNYYTDIINSTKEILSHYISNNLENILDIEINNIFRTIMLDAKYSNKNNFNFDEVLKKRLSFSPCDYVANHQLSIRNDGKATLCQYFHNTIFDFKKYNFDIEKTLKYKNYVLENEILMSNLDYCSKCKYCLVCNSGCRSRAKFFTKNIIDSDPGACYLAPKIHKEIIPLLPKETQLFFNSLLNEKGLEPKYNLEDLKIFLKGKGY